MQYVGSIAAKRNILCYTIAPPILVIIYGCGVQNNHYKVRSLVLQGSLSGFARITFIPLMTASADLNSSVACSTLNSNNDTARRSSRITMIIARCCRRQKWICHVQHVCQKSFGSLQRQQCVAGSMSIVQEVSFHITIYAPQSYHEAPVDSIGLVGMLMCSVYSSCVGNGVV